MQTLDVPAGVSGELQLQFRMRVMDAKMGIVYWSTHKRPNFVREYRAEFAVPVAEQWHTYSVPFTAEEALRGIRHDAAMNPTQIDVAWIRLCRKDGRVLKEWLFDQP